MGEIYRKVLRGEKLTEDEICELYQDSDSIDEKVVYLDECSVKHYIVIKLEDRYFKVYATLGFDGEDYYGDQPEEVTPVKEMVEVTNWIKK